MPSLLVNVDGTAEARFETDRFVPAQLLDADGSAVIVHAGADNFANVPTRYHSHVPDASSTTYGPDATTLGNGDAGARTACGLVRRAR
jgi:Cu-Zn family superoxide dismutase